MVLAVSPRSRPTETHTWYLRRFRSLFDFGFSVTSRLYSIYLHMQSTMHVWYFLDFGMTDRMLTGN